MKKVLVTGGLGYIGSHCVVELESKGYDTLIIDNLSNSDKENLSNINKITSKKIPFEEGDVTDKLFLNKIFKNHSIKSVIHCAGLKSVEESLKEPDLYYKNNIQGTNNLLEAMDAASVRKIIFSSSATIYGDQTEMPIKESVKKNVPKNPYGASKLKVEKILEEKFHQNNDWSIISLRYFNPVGAHSSGKIGEKNYGRKAANLMPIILDVASGYSPFVKIFGNDYSTKDGTPIRDFIHVQDLARAHISALEKIEKEKVFVNLNVGTGIGYSVLEVIRQFEISNKIKVPINFAKRRAGDIAVCVADTTLAKEFLDWDSKHDLDKMCSDSWNFFQNI